MSVVGFLCNLVTSLTVRLLFRVVLTSMHHESIQFVISAWPQTWNVVLCTNSLPTSPRVGSIIHEFIPPPRAMICNSPSHRGSDFKRATLNSRGFRNVLIPFENYLEGGKRSNDKLKKKTILMINERFITSYITQ
jgi:hypothetical protein